ncbi:hypothetical protein GGS26DRAFT_597838 [Hypomontagnella submonticulosa]|nr:hypothetical protein GGS26DRAFT_597838 [Hypomontagnella submonticulosa]
METTQGHMYGQSHQDEISTDLERGKTQDHGCRIPLEVWCCIGDVITSERDLLNLSLVNKTMWSRLTYQRAALEARNWRILLRPLYPSYVPKSTCVNKAIFRGEKLEIIEKMIRGCCSGYQEHLNGLQPFGLSPPALFIAAQMNRVDVMKLLVSLNVCHLDIEYNSYIWEWGGGRVPRYPSVCLNALCVARVAGSKEATDYLLEQGVEDKCDCYCWWRHGKVFGSRWPYYYCV